MEDFFCRSHSDWEHFSKRHIRSKIKRVTCDNREEIDACICYPAAAKKRTRVRNNLRRKRPDVYL